jgi:SAM-dependent methyltransferase
MSLVLLVRFAWFVYLVLLLCVLYLLARPVIRGAYYFPTKARSVDLMIEMADLTPGQRVADIGSGDGRILMAFAKKGIEAHGYEINPLLVLSSRQAIRRAHLEDRAFVHRKDFWKVNFAGFDAVTVYGIPRIMKDLGEKLEKESTSGIKVISNIYKLPGREPLAVKEKVYLYRIGEKIMML